MTKKNVTGVDICGSMTSLKPFKNMIGEMGHFGGYVLLLWGSSGGPEGPRWGNYPSQMLMSQYDEEKRGWCGYQQLHGITLLKRVKAQKMVFFRKYHSIVKNQICIGNDKIEKTKTYKPFELCKEKTYVLKNAKFLFCWPEWFLTISPDFWADF